MGETPDQLRRVERREVSLTARTALLLGDLEVPEGASGAVVFAHGSGSSRQSPRNRYVAERLQQAGFATLLFDLLTEKEDEDPHRRFDVDLLATRLIGTVEWFLAQPDIGALPIGLFGASTGAAAAIYTAAHLPKEVQAVVSRGGRPDLAMEALCLIHIPTLFIVGELDKVVLDLNRESLAALPSGTVKELQIVPNASHLFEEPGTLDEVSRIASEWYKSHLQLKSEPTIRLF